MTTQSSGEMAAMRLGLVCNRLPYSINFLERTWHETLHAVKEDVDRI
jgi:hypothetical protein